MSTGRFALKFIAVAAASATLVLPTAAWPLGLGRLSVQSALGESLRAEIDISSLTPEEASNLKVRVASPETYRAAGVDYNSVLPSTNIVLERRADGRPFLRLISDRPVQEPFVDVILELSWSSGRLVREYTLLFDPPAARAAAPAVSPAGIGPAMTPTAPAAPSPAAQGAPALVQTPVSPVESAPPRVVAAPVPDAPRAQMPGRPASSPSQAEVTPPPAQPPVRQAKPASVVTPTQPQAVASAPDDSIRVRRGDTLSRIAARARPQGVSLDQMLVGLYRANPEAFIGNNMNRLKSGVVLAVPQAEELSGIAASEARQVIQAQSADFNAYRQRLASAVPAAPVDQPARQASGKVQAEVQDRKQAAAPAPDKLTLSKGGVVAGAPTTEDKLAKERAVKESATRVAELSKNLEELKKLQGAATGTQSTPKTSPAPTVTESRGTAQKASAALPARTPASAPQLIVVTPPASAPAKTVTLIPPASAPTAVVAEAAKPSPDAASVVAASAPEQLAMQPAATASEPASEVAAAPVVVAPKAAPRPKPRVQPPPPPPEEPGFLDGLLDNPMLMPAAVLLLALGAGVGFYQFRSRRKSDSGETSFLESRLQPDSFFGASGGQRIDTRDASGAPSSMSYSLSQLDAIGDVDPVAEADVYLAYGRDLQAEEILKEAMRGSPERLAIRLKLLEVYAKRRDTKGFEQLAIQMYGLTQGQGDDWAKAQELGASIDPENPLYQPGGMPSEPAQAVVSEARMTEPLDGSTMPQSVLPAAAAGLGVAGFAAAASASAAVPPSDVDLDLDLPIEGGDSDPGSSGGLQWSDVPEPVSAAAAPLNGSFETSSPNAASAEFDLPELEELPPSPQEPHVPPSVSGPEAGASMEFDLSDINLDLGAPGATAPAASAPSNLPQLETLDLGQSPDLPLDDADPMQRKIELAEEFRQIGDVEGARDLLEEVISRAEGALRAKAQSMLEEMR